MTLLELSACGSVIVLLGALLRRLRLPKPACMVLWWAAVLRLLLPFGLPAPWSVYTFLKTLKTLAAKPAPVLTGPPAMVLPPLETVPVLPAMPETAPVETTPFPVRTAVWLAGATLLGIWFLGSYVRWRRRFREALPAECGFLRQWNPRHPHIRVKISDRIAAPLTYGFLRPVILLPKGFDLSDEASLLCILTHETVHIRRLDSLLKLLLSAALCVHWFNPAVWLLWVLAGRDMELRCDQTALSRLGPENRAAYAMTLLRMAELRNESMPLCNSFNECGMEERIIAIMKFKKPSVLVLTAALALALCITAAFATTAWKEPAKTPAPPASAKADDVKNAPLDTKEALSALKSLEDSIRFEDGTFRFTIPTGENGGNRWNIWISGRVLTASDEESGMVMSVHYLETESEKGEWVSGKTYSFQSADAAYDELTMTAALGDEEAVIDLTPFLPEDAAPLEVPEAPEIKPGTPEDGGEDGALIWPVESKKVSSAVGSFNPSGEGEIVHNGVDIAGMDSGEPVYAAGKGTVKAVGFDSKNGNYILLDHGDGLESYYSSCGSILVQTGETVKMGQHIATVGQTGMSTGPHLHFEIRKNGVVQNPFDYEEELGDAYQYTTPSLKEGEAFYAPMAGKVLNVYPTNYDYLELVMDYGGEAHTYTNCATVAVKPGDEVQQDDLLGIAKGPMVFGSGVPTEQYLHLMNLAQKDAEEWLVDGDYPRNKNGQTYAPDQRFTNLLGYPPDLVGATATNGQKGYIEEKELIRAQQLVIGTWEAYTDPTAVASRSIPVYNEEGDVIGEFEISAGGFPTVTTNIQSEDGETDITVTTPAP